MLCTTLSKEAYPVTRPTFGKVSISPDVLKTIENLPCPICGGEILTLDKVQQWNTKSLNYCGEKLSHLLQDTFAKQAPTQIETKVALGCCEILDKTSASLNFEETAAILRERSQKGGGQSFWESLEESFAFVEKLNIPEQVRENVLSWYESMFSGLEVGEPISELYHFLSKNINHYQHGCNGPFYRRVFDETTIRLDPLAAADIFFKKKETVQNMIKRMIQRYRPTFDHLIPKSEGGQNCVYNYVPMQQFCNEDRDILSWQQLVSFGYTTVEKIQNFVDSMLKAIRVGAAGDLEENYIESIVDRFNYQLGSNYIEYKV